MMILILDSNIELMKLIDKNDLSSYNPIYDSAVELKQLFDKTNEQLVDINKEYQLVIDMAKEAQAEIERLQKKK